MKTKEFKGIISRNTAKDNSLILNVIEYSCIPFNSWFETHSRLEGSPGIGAAFFVCGCILINVKVTGHNEKGIVLLQLIL